MTRRIRVRGPLGTRRIRVRGPLNGGWTGLLKRVLLSIALALIVAVGTPPTSTAQDDSAIRDVASGSDYRIRVAAALALGKSKNPGARAALERALSDSHPAVRAAAAAGLGRLGDAGAVPALKSALSRESTPSVKTQMESTIAKLGGGGSGSSRAKFLVQVGRIDVRAGGATYNVATLKAATRDKMAALPGVEIVADGADVGAASQSRGLPGFTVDGSLTRLAKATSSGGVSVSARVEYLVKKMPDHALKATMSGTAEAEADQREIRGAKEMEQLQQDAVNAAVDSAFKQANRAFESSSK
jgi:hypothetical protein